MSGFQNGYEIMNMKRKPFIRRSQKKKKDEKDSCTFQLLNKQKQNKTKRNGVFAMLYLFKLKKIILIKFFVMASTFMESIKPFKFSSTFSCYLPNNIFLLLPCFFSFPSSFLEPSSPTAVESFLAATSIKRPQIFV